MHILILEDEWPAAERLQNLLKELIPDLVVDAVLETGLEATEWLLSNPQPNLIFSDIELADGLCFEVFAKSNAKIPVIFATAYNQYAIRAFEAHAIDYLLKPIHLDALRKSLTKFKDRTGYELPDRNYARISEEITMKRLPEKQFLVRYGQKLFLLEASSIAYYYSEHKASYAVVSSGKAYPLDESLSAIEEYLPAKEYFRINRNMIVKRNSIVSMETRSKGRLQLTLDPMAHNINYTTVSAERSPAFRKWISRQNPAQ